MGDIWIGNPLWTAKLIVAVTGKTLLSSDGNVNNFIGVQPASTNASTIPKYLSEAVKANRIKIPSSTKRFTEQKS
jgi:hypothetical protein